MTFLFFLIVTLVTSCSFYESCGEQSGNTGTCPSTSAASAPQAAPSPAAASPATSQPSSVPTPQAGAMAQPSAQPVSAPDGGYIQGNIADDGVVIDGMSYQGWQSYLDFELQRLGGAVGRARYVGNPDLPSSMSVTVATISGAPFTGTATVHDDGRNGFLGSVPTGHSHDLFAVTAAKRLPVAVATKDGKTVTSYCLALSASVEGVEMESRSVLSDFSTAVIPGNCDEDDTGNAAPAQASANEASGATVSITVSATISTGEAK